jgi:hypothetical protein
MKRKIAVYIFIVSMVSSCKMKGDADSINYAINFVSQNDEALQFVKTILNQSIDSVDKKIIFTTEKPGSHILLYSCDSCIKNIVKNTEVQIADYIDEHKISYIGYKPSSYLEVGFYFGNCFYNQYFIREYNSLSDTIIYAQPYLRQYHLKNNWMLYSDQRKE